MLLSLVIDIELVEKLKIEWVELKHLTFVCFFFEEVREARDVGQNFVAQFVHHRYFLVLNHDKTFLKAVKKLFINLHLIQ